MLADSKGGKTCQLERFKISCASDKIEPHSKINYTASGRRRTAHKLLYLLDLEASMPCILILHVDRYCIQTTGELTKSDVDLFKAIDFSFLTVIVVVTKCDELRNQYLQETCKRYRQAHPEQPECFIHEMPSEASATVKADAFQTFVLAKEDKRQSIKRELEGDFDCVVVSKTPAGMFIQKHLSIFNS